MDSFFGLLERLIAGGKETAPWVLSLVLGFLYHLERKRVTNLSEKLFQLGMATTKSSTEMQATLRAVEKGVDEIRYRHRGE
jgi:hypothetical protein